MSVGQESGGPSIGAGSIGAAPANDDENVTHTRGRIDDMVRHLGIIRGAITAVNWPSIAAHLDDADAAVERATEQVVGDGGVS